MGIDRNTERHDVVTNDTGGGGFFGGYSIFSLILNKYLHGVEREVLLFPKSGNATMLLHPGVSKDRVTRYSEYYPRSVGGQIHG